MKCFNRFRAKDPVLATIISMGMIMSAQAIAGAQSNDWEEVGPSAISAQQQLMTAPPMLGANVSGQIGYRSPVATTPVATKTGIQNEYIVQAGDTLPKIAMKVYGDPNRWQDLMVLNNIDNSNRIYIGQKLNTVASSNIVAEDAPVAEHEIAEMPLEESESESADASYGSVSADGTYTVKRGDTLGKIAKVCLGSTSKWQKIAKVNPNINPNKLKVGDVLVIPGANNSSSMTVAAQPLGTTPVSERAVSSQPWQMAAVNADNTVAYNNYGYIQPEMTVSAPSFDPNTAPVIAPPPPPMGYGSYNTAPATTANPAVTVAPPAPPAPPAQMPIYESNPVTVYSSGTSYPQPVETAEYTTTEVVPCKSENKKVISDQPVATNRYEVYREEKYRLPDELRMTDFDPYFTNSNGYRGLFKTESALIPYLPTWNIGFSYKYDKIKYFNGEKGIIDADSSVAQMNLNYTGHKIFAGISVPYVSWTAKDAKGGKESDLSGVGDTSVKFGYQVWKNFEGTHAVTLHLEGKFPGGNYHRPILGEGLKTKLADPLGRVVPQSPSGTTEGAWVEFGGAYTGVVNEKWTNHMNLALANDSKDGITKVTLRAGTDYRVNRNFSLVGEVEAERYQADNDKYGKNGMNADLTLGMVVYNDAWQANIGFPINIKHDWGQRGDFSVIAGINHRWD